MSFLVSAALEMAGLALALVGLAIGGLIGTIIGRAIYGHPIKFEGPSDDEPLGEASSYRREVK